MALTVAQALLEVGRIPADSTIGHSVSEGQKWRDTQRDYFTFFSASLLHVRPQGY